jgi:hypothetical protein
MSSTDPSIFQQLYDAEINFEVSCFWDDGFHVRLGDRMNGYRAEAHVATWQEVEVWLRENGFKEFPRAEPAEGRGESRARLDQRDRRREAAGRLLALTRVPTLCSSAAFRPTGCLCFLNKSTKASSVSS